jgi:hypothetical protein
MRVAALRAAARTAWGLNRYLQTALSLEQATAAVTDRLASREESFLRLAKSMIYANASSPYRQLLSWAGCEFGDLEESVRQIGVEATLERLSASGVYVSLEEFERKQPICRPGLTLCPRETDFDNPSLLSFEIPLTGLTSGTRSASKRVSYSWDLLNEVASNEMVLYAAHDLLQTPLAVWYPTPPSLAGLNNVLTNTKFGAPPERWFSHLASNESLAPRTTSLALHYLTWTAYLQGTRIPAPERISIQEAHKVADWMARTKAARGSCVVRSYTSSAVRIAEAAQAARLDIRDCTIFAGGEPLTPRRHRFITASGAKVFARYVITELGHIAGACPYSPTPGSMHVYTDRLALIQHPVAAPDSSGADRAFLFTSLSRYTPKIAFNTCLGDIGRIDRRTCPCSMGRLGLDLHVSDVRNLDKLTGEGMTILASELEDLIGELVDSMGGCPDDYQFWQEDGPTGVPRLIVALSPSIHDTLHIHVQQEILKRLTLLKGGAAASTLWAQAGTITVIRANPQLTKGFKMLPFSPIPRP